MLRPMPIPSRSRSTRARISGSSIGRHDLRSRSRPEDHDHQPQEHHGHTCHPGLHAARSAREPRDGRRLSRRRRPVCRVQTPVRRPSDATARRPPPSRYPDRELAARRLACSSGSTTSAGHRVRSRPAPQCRPRSVCWPPAAGSVADRGTGRPRPGPPARACGPESAADSCTDSLGKQADETVHGHSSFSPESSLFVWAWVSSLRISARSASLTAVSSEEPASWPLGRPPKTSLSTRCRNGCKDLAFAPGRLVDVGDPFVRVRQQSLLLHHLHHGEDGSIGPLLAVRHRLQDLPRRRRPAFPQTPTAPASPDRKA